MNEKTQIINLLKLLLIHQIKRGSNYLDCLAVKARSFKKGQVYEMKPGVHTISSYFVLIKEVGKDYIITTIPEHHSLVIKEKTSEWNYHIRRMRYIGEGHEYQVFLYNQHHLGKDRHRGETIGEHKIK